MNPQDLDETAKTYGLPATDLPSQPTTPTKGKKRGREPVSFLPTPPDTPLKQPEEFIAVGTDPRHGVNVQDALGGDYVSLADRVKKRRRVDRTAPLG